MEPIQKGKQTNKTSNTCTGDKGKQTNKQAEVACVEVWMQGAVRSCITCGVRYTMCQSMQKSFRDASEMHWKSAEFDMQGCTLTATCAVSWAMCSSVDMVGSTAQGLQGLSFLLLSGHVQDWECT